MVIRDGTIYRLSWFSGLTITIFISNLLFPRKCSIYNFQNSRIPRERKISRHGIACFNPYSTNFGIGTGIVYHSISVFFLPLKRDLGVRRTAVSFLWGGHQGLAFPAADDLHLSARDGHGGSQYPPCPALGLERYERVDQRPFAQFVCLHFHPLGHRPGMDWGPLEQGPVMLLNISIILSFAALFFAVLSPPDPPRQKISPFIPELYRAHFPDLSLVQRSGVNRVTRRKETVDLAIRA